MTLLLWKTAELSSIRNDPSTGIAVKFKFGRDDILGGEKEMDGKFVIAPTIWANQPPYYEYKNKEYLYFYCFITEACPVRIKELGLLELSSSRDLWFT